MQIQELRPYLTKLVHTHYGTRSEVRHLSGFAGSHGGLTYGFEVWQDDRCIDSLVIRLSPVGVRRSGNTDVLRQVPLLQTLQTHGFLVPKIRFYGADDDVLPTAYVVFERRPGRAFIVWEPDGSFARSPERIANIWYQAVAQIAQVHRFDWQRYLVDWENPQPIEAEVPRWDPILAKAAESHWRDLGEEVRALLLRDGPPPSPLGLMHGDCQPGNILFDPQGNVTALLDWELSGIGAQYYDLGWQIMIGDRESWHPAWCPVNSLQPADIIARYQALTGRDCAGLEWYRALAGYRMAVVTGLYVGLHREGRRPDAAWEKFALAVPALYGRAKALLQGGGR